MMVEKKFYEIGVSQLLGFLSRFDCFAFFDTSLPDEENYLSYICFLPFHKIITRQPDEIENALRKAEEFSKDRKFVVFLLPYEAGFVFEPSFEYRKKLKFPCVFLFFDRCIIFDHRNGLFSEPIFLEEFKNSIPDWKMNELWYDTPYNHYKKNIAKIKKYIRKGDTYQVNYTIRCRFRFSGSVYKMYLDLRERQQVPYSALIKFEDYFVLSLSPELFFRKEKSRIIVRPMKGTIERGKTKKRDIQNENALRNSIKNRAENLMIVDMMRNDLGRICKFGSVITDPLFKIERYKTLFQMTSTVSGTLIPKTGICRILKAIFPSSSITGAPKIRTMQIIDEIEKSSRKIYTGTIGILKPDNSAVFNVAIRTIIVRKNFGEMGTGGGIVYDSEPKKEYDECLLKAAFLASGCKKMQLIETIRWSSKEGYFLLDLHLERLKKSAGFFRFDYDRKRTLKMLEKTASSFDSSKTYRVRLLLYQDGSVFISSQEIDLKFSGIPAVIISGKKINRENIFLYHKTTIRDTYDRAHKFAMKKGYFDVIFQNKEGEITEGCIANVFAEKNGVLYTPPANCGLLPGVFRQFLINQGCAKEKTLKREDIYSCDRVFLGNSVRGLVEVKIVDDDLS
ncbi:MAG: aminodeoxychorismate synthase component I [Candidatus Omnitrophica bacterium]|nr:aminodeoxychorismate synthase component I [Candidatus Omnitrophota bacterium]MCM8828600.1 aminodeoxychorismate synthase component I [Candidatus Omnitrophota bacterium]